MCSTWPANRSANWKLPGKGTADAITGDQSDKEAFFVFTSYNVPTEVYRYDVLTDKIEAVRQPKVKFDPDEFRRRAGVLQEQRRHAGADDARVSQGPGKKAQPQPTLLYGYGGYNISMLPAFRPEYIAWMEMGGVVAVANLRGGGEYGEEWHLAGKALKKQNVFDDFIAAAEWLIARRPHVARQARDHGRQQRRAAWSAPSKCSGPICSAPASRWSA